MYVGYSADAFRITSPCQKVDMTDQVHICLKVTVGSGAMEMKIQFHDTATRTKPRRKDITRSDEIVPGRQ